MSTLPSDFFDRPFADLFTYNSSSDPRTQVDWKETPGFSKEDVKLQLVDGRAVQISGERKEEAEAVEKGCKWHCPERESASGVHRQFRLPDNVKVKEIKASMRDAVLTLTETALVVGTADETEAMLVLAIAAAVAEATTVANPAV